MLCLQGFPGGFFVEALTSLLMCRNPCNVFRTGRKHQDGITVPWLRMAETIQGNTTPEGVNVVPMDRFFRGFLAGLLAGIPMNIWSLFSYHVLHFGQRRFLDWMGIILYGNLPLTFGEQAYALFGQFFGLGVLGILYAYLLAAIGSQWYVGKAVIYSGAFSFVVYALPMLFRVPNLTEMPMNAVISNHIGALIWGIFLGYVQQRLESGARMED